VKELLLISSIVLGVSYYGTEPTNGHFNALNCDVQVGIAEYILSSKPEDQSAVPDALISMRADGLLSHSQYIAAVQVLNVWRQSKSSVSFRRTMRELCPHHRIPEAL
jgi:hypothetical protein